MFYLPNLTYILSRLQKLSDYGVSLLVLMSIGFVPSGFAAYLIRERNREEKQVQLVVGVSKLTYWLTTALYDLFVSNIISLLNNNKTIENYRSSCC